MFLRFGLFALGVAAVSAGCGSPSPAPACSVPVTSCPAVVPSYSKDVAPVIARRCAPCHAPGGLESNRPYQTYDQVKSVQVGILFQVRSCKMPPADGGTPLSDDEKATLLGWLYCDAPNN